MKPVYIYAQRDPRDTCSCPSCVSDMAFIHPCMNKKEKKNA